MNTIALPKLLPVAVQAARASVQEATELADLFQKVDSVFASGNLQRIASLLATMRRSLTLVGSVPEFRGAREKLEACLQDPERAVRADSIVYMF